MVRKCLIYSDKNIGYKVGRIGVGCPYEEVEGAVLSYSAVVTESLRRGVFAVLDMGSTKVVCLAVRVRNDGRLEVVGVGCRAADGLNGGAITNKQYAGYSVMSSIDLAEQVSEHAIDQVYVSVAGCGISSQNISNELVSPVHEMSERDARRIMLQTYEKFYGDDIVIHNVPIAYHLDDLNNVMEVRGLYGSRLRADVHVVTASKLALLNVENCLTKNNLGFAGCVAEPYSSGLACLTEDEKELGAMIIDMGGNFTSIGIFDKGRFVYADSVPLGGVHITRDIAYGLCTSVKDAERIKKLHGTVMLAPEDKDVIELDDGDPTVAVQPVTKSQLTNIIRPRVEEILELVKSKMDRKKSNIVSRVVVTGGCSNLKGIREITSRVLNKQVRTGSPANVYGMKGEYARNSMFSAAVGTAMLVASTIRQSNSRGGGSSLMRDRYPNTFNGKILKWLSAVRGDV